MPEMQNQMSLSFIQKQIMEVTMRKRTNERGGKRHEQGAREE